MPRDDAAGARWEDATTWPLMTASAVFLVGYSWIVLDPGMPVALFVVLWIILGLVWLAFLVDYIVRITLSSNRLYFFEHNTIDLLSVLLPIARPFRLVKYLNRLPLLRGNSGTSLRRRVVIVAAFFVVLFIYVLALAEFSVERDAPHALITSFGDSVWWACVTMATVGYGDFYPVTVPGRVIAVVLMIGGIAIVGTASATVVSLLSERMSEARVRRGVEHPGSPEPRAPHAPTLDLHAEPPDPGAPDKPA